MRATLPFILRPAAATLLILGAPALHALEAPRPVPDVGVTHEYSGRLLGVDCPAWTVTAVTPDGGTRAECQGHHLETDGGDGNAMHVLDPTGRKLVEFRPFAPALKFPLTLGAHWRQGYTGFTAFNNLVWDGEANCRVEALEAVRVPAGEFEAFRIECQDKWMVGPKNGYTHTTRWYAPAAETIVKQVHREDPERWNFELTRIVTTSQTPAAPATAPTMNLEALPPAGPRPIYDPSAPDILDPDEY